MQLAGKVSFHLHLKTEISSYNLNKESLHHGVIFEMFTVKSPDDITIVSLGFRITSRLLIWLF